MGNSHTTPDTNTPTDDRAAIAQQEKDQRQKALWVNGILVPPIFGIPTNATSSRMIPSIILNTTASTTTTESSSSTILCGYVDYLRTQSDLSHRLIHTHVQPGLWITSLTSKHALRVGIFDNHTNSHSWTRSSTKRNIPDAGHIPSHDNDPFMQRSNTLSSDTSISSTSTTVTTVTRG